MPSSSLPLIEARDLVFGYRRPQAILQDVSVSLESGTLSALTGPSGRGKSTLLYLLAGLLLPWSGSVAVDGTDQAALSDAARARYRARHFGFMFQDVILDPRRSLVDAVLEPTLYANVSRDAHVERATSLLSSLGLDGRSAALPGQLSGGQAQRVGVCRALLMEPRVVFADEPTGNLDTESADVVLDQLESAAEGGATVVIATHDPRVVSRCGARIELA